VLTNVYRVCVDTTAVDERLPPDTKGNTTMTTTNLSPAGADLVEALRAFGEHLTMIARAGNEALAKGEDAVARAYSAIIDAEVSALTQATGRLRADGEPGRCYDVDEAMFVALVQLVDGYADLTDAADAADAAEWAS
jgi:3-oxoacyl-ACP reductase-like protein